MANQPDTPRASKPVGRHWLWLVGIAMLLYVVPFIVALRRGEWRVAVVCAIALLGILVGLFRKERSRALAWAKRASLVTFVLALLLIIGALPPAMEYRVRGGAKWNQGSAVGAIRSINTAEMTYAETYKAGFSPSLAALAPPADNEQPTASAAGLVDSVLAGGRKNGYTLAYTPGPKDASGHITTYTVVARPVEYGKSGRMSFFTDESGVVRVTGEDRPATVKDPPLVG